MWTAAVDFTRHVEMKLLQLDVTNKAGERSQPWAKSRRNSSSSTRSTCSSRTALSDTLSIYDRVANQVAGEVKVGSLN